VLVVLLFAVALMGILVTGPVVVRVSPFDFEVQVSTDHLRDNLETLCDEFTPRDHRHVENLDRAANWIEERFRDADLDVEQQEYVAGSKTYRNVIAARRGSDPSAEVVVIGAHYDAYEGSRGANDNASGVAVLLELARTLPETRPLQTHYLVAFGTEEPPYFGSREMGSYVFAQKLIDEQADVELMVAIDLVGFFSDEPGSQRLPAPLMRLFYPNRDDFVVVIGDLRSGRSIELVKRGLLAAGDLPVESFRAPSRWSPVLLSDHLSFRRLGLPGVQIADTAFNRYPHCHPGGGTADEVAYERMAMLVEALHGLLWEGRPQLPEDNAVPNSPETPNASNG